jgi:hypothetical protein
LEGLIIQATEPLFNVKIPMRKCMMQATEQINHLDAETARAFLEKLPCHIREAFYARAAAIKYPIEAVLESAVASQLRFALNASSLDPDALSFVDCKPELLD